MKAEIQDRTHKIEWRILRMSEWVLTKPPRSTMSPSLVLGALPIFSGVWNKCWILRHFLDREPPHTPKIGNVSYQLKLCTHETDTNSFLCALMNDLKSPLLFCATQLCFNGCFWRRKKNTFFGVRDNLLIEFMYSRNVECLLRKCNTKWIADIINIVLTVH